MKKFYKAYCIIGIILIIFGLFPLAFEVAKLALITYIIDKAVEHHSKDKDKGE